MDSYEKKISPKQATSDYNAYTLGKNPVILVNRKQLGRKKFSSIFSAEATVAATERPFRNEENLKAKSSKLRLASKEYESAHDKMLATVGSI